MTRSIGPAGDPHPYFQLSTILLVVFCVAVAVACVDAMDGETLARRSGIVRFSDDPGRFRGTLVVNYGLYGIGALIGSAASAAGGIAIQRTNRSKKS